MNQMSTDREFDADITIAGPQSGLATPIDRLSTLFALRLVLALGPKFNLRRDINDVMTLCARHLVWPVSVAQKVQKFLGARCVEMPAWAGVNKLAPDEFVARHGVWNGTYDDTTLFYYLDEFCKQNAKDLLALFQTTVDALEKATRDTPVRIEQNIEMLVKVLGLNPAERALICAHRLRKSVAICVRFWLIANRPVRRKHTRCWAT